MKFTVRCTGRVGCDCFGHRRFTTPQQQRAATGHVQAAPVRDCPCEVCKYARQQRAS